MAVRPAQAKTREQRSRRYQDHLRRPFVAQADQLLPRGDVSCSPKTDRVRRELLVLATPLGGPNLSDWSLPFD
jgi:hypothetical protein